MTITTMKYPIRRKLIGSLALWPWLAGCTGIAGASTATPTNAQRRFNGIGIVLVVDAVPDVKLHGVSFYDDRTVIVYASSLVARKNRDTLVLGSVRVPLTVRAVWREDEKSIWGKSGGIEYVGTPIGDYTISVADRIPDEVLNDIRAHGGDLRLKFRLKPDGVLFGWDIERDGKGTGHPLRYDMSGGDFLETLY
jgi:hypothetical protein